MRTCTAWLTIALALFVAPLSSARDVEAAAGRKPEELSADPSTIASIYARNRLLFQSQRADIDNELERLEQAIDGREAALQALRKEKARVAERVASSARDRLEGLRTLTHVVENATIVLLQPLPVIGARLWNAADDDPPFRLAGRRASDDISLYLSIVLPVSLGLALVLARRLYRDFFDRHRKNLLLSTLMLMLILPLSSFAQEAGSESPERSESVPGAAEAPLQEILRQAEEMLGLSRTRRYISLLTSPDARGKRIRVSEVDLSATPFRYFTSVVVGTGEYHATLAALYLADGDRDAAIRELRALARPETRYATRDSDPDAYGSIFRTAALFLLRNDAQALAVNITRLHMQDLISDESFRQLYPELMQHSLTATAGELAGRIVDESDDAVQLIGYAESLYASGADAQARAALDKALRSAAGPQAVEAIVELGLLQEDSIVVDAAVARAPVLVEDVALLLRVADKLRDAGLHATANRLLENAIDRIALRELSTVQGRPVSTTEALTFLSSESFERRLLGIAEKAAIAAIKPLSRAERSNLVISAPPVVIDPLRVPEPDELKSPLYFGLLYEKQGRTEAAKARFAAESRTLAETLVASKGLYVPDMINHLSLLGSTLDGAEEAETLVQLDRLLQRLERRSLDDMRASQSGAINRRQTQIDRADAQLLALQKEIDALSAALEPRGLDVLQRAVSAMLLILRALALIALCYAIVAAVVMLARRYALRRTTNRVYALWWKLVEGMGWVWVLSVFSAPLGLLAIVIAQFFLLSLSRNGRSPPVTEPVRPAERPSAGPSPAFALEKEARLEESVLQMLRDSKRRRAS